jgi:hypothetical protein
LEWLARSVIEQQPQRPRLVCAVARRSGLQALLCSQILERAALGGERRRGVGVGGASSGGMSSGGVSSDGGAGRGMSLKPHSALLVRTGRPASTTRDVAERPADRAL